ncbi:sialic acid-binding Ig-like lectin 14 [Embiotoca jacksoni]|uniref:sialic acid-binding Ig-like lectin 14 n=1 Tax=Embiotoca jacksoni TaxID=100190 RepID=UPI0037049E84
MMVEQRKSSHTDLEELFISQTGAELTVRKTEEDEEAIHYGEIDFSKLRPEKSSESVQDSGQQQDLVYAQVRVSEPADSSMQTAEGPEELYAQVKSHDSIEVCSVWCIMTVLSVNIMLLVVLFFSSPLSACPKDSGLFITSPAELEALSGSCLLIPCNFSVNELMNTTGVFGVWIKRDISFHTYPDNVIFNSSHSVQIYAMKLTGNLTQKSCTTRFSDLNTNHSEIYFFRIENGPFRATAVCNPLQITIKDSPWKPRIEISGDLKEKKSVTITCSAFTPCPHSPPQLTWTLQQDSHNNMEENTDGTFTTKIQETVTLSDSHDGNNISCSARYPVNEGDFKTAETEVTLNVSYAPKDTSASISPSGLVSAGSSVNLTCSSRAKPPVSSFTWFKSSTDGPMKVSEGEIYSFKMTSETDTESYYCVAANIFGNQTSSWIHVNNAGTGSFLLRLLLITGSTVIILLLVVYICWFKSKYSTRQQTQSQTREEFALQVPANVKEEEIHYEDVSFSRPRPERLTVSVQDGGQQQETEYAQVQVLKVERSVTHTAGGPEELYAQVKTN